MLDPREWRGGRLLILLAGAAILGAAGCGGGSASGPDAGGAEPDGGADAGPPALDAGPPRVDAGPPARDAGPPPVDAGPPPVDAGPPPMDAGPPEPDAGPPELDAGPADAGPLTAEACFEGVFVGSTPAMGPDYEPFMPVIGSHCRGTNHQDITGIERVVFLGDSVTVGTPPTRATEFYRSLLADRLVTRFGLSPPNALWKNADPFSGTSVIRESGDFASCAEWGARTDDLMRDGSQVLDCLPASEQGKRTLVIMTIGGNDIANIAEGGADGAPVADLWVQTMEFVRLLRDAIAWITAPGRFPNGVYVAFANMFEFTDGTGDTSTCPAAELSGLGAPWDDPTALQDMVIWANEQYMQIAVDSGTDMIFMLEEFCGHGHARTDPAAPCYRGPGAEAWFDLTCIHPTPLGHRQIADMFEAVIAE